MPLILNGTTGVSGIDGSAGTPSYVGGDSDTGLWYPAANTLALSTGGSERLRIDSSGNVGIGTTSPSYKLDVVGSPNDEVSIRAYNSTAGSLATARVYAQSDTALIQVSSFSSTFGFNLFGTSAANFSALTTSGASSAGLMLGTLTSDPIIIGTNGVETMRISNGQQVGIGTNAPSQTLYVQGTTYLTPYIGSGGLNIIASYAYNNGTANTIGGGYQDQVTTLMIFTSGVGYTALPIYCNAGGGVAYRWTYLDPDAGTWTYSAGSDIDVTFSNAGGSINTYRVIITAGGGSGTIQRTAGTTAYTVYVQRLIGA